VPSSYRPSCDSPTEAANLTRPAGVSHQPTCRQERQMQWFKSACHARRFLSTHSHIHNYVQLTRRHLTANKRWAA